MESNPSQEEVEQSSSLLVADRYLWSSGKGSLNLLPIHVAYAKDVEELACLVMEKGNLLPADTVTQIGIDNGHYLVKIMMSIKPKQQHHDKQSLVSQHMETLNML